MTRSQGPVVVPGPGGDTAIAREPLWHAWATGTDVPAVPEWARVPEPPPETHVAPPPPVGTSRGRRQVLPLGTVDLLESAGYPHGRPTTGADPLGHALVTAFGPCRREPENPYNDHRPYASARCLFPVQVVVRDHGRPMLLDPARHSLVELDAPAAPGTREVVLAGRYPVVPRDYRWFRGSLISLELGTTLRALGLALELFGLRGALRLPGTDAREELTSLGLVPAREWSLPLTVALDGSALDRPAEHGDEPRPAAPPGPAPRAPSAGAALDPGVDRALDPVLAEVLGVDRAQAFDPAPVALGEAVPAQPPLADLSWAELLWRRSSGRMPRGLHGMGARRRRTPAPALAGLAAWAAVRPPGELGHAYDAVRVTAVLQGVDGAADGVHAVEGGRARLVAEDPGAFARLEDAYGYPPTPGTGCDVRHAAMTWFLSVRPRDLVQRSGPTGWTAAHHACGWILHGLCLGAAAAGLFARPVRAFREVAVQRVLGLDPEEMVVVAVVVGHPRHLGGPVLDIRL